MDRLARVSVIAPGEEPFCGEITDPHHRSVAPPGGTVGILAALLTPGPWRIRILVKSHELGVFLKEYLS